LVVIGALAVVVSAVAAEPAMPAKGGNSANAKACQKGGWQSLFTTTGGTFANQSECVSYAAQGGTLLAFAGQGACDSIGGTFVVGGRNPQDIWTCRRYPVPPNDPLPPPQVTACRADGGVSFGAVTNFDGTFTSVCAGPTSTSGI
jgi:hypothetical protein